MSRSESSYILYNSLFQILRIVLFCNRSYFHLSNCIIKLYHVYQIFHGTMKREIGGQS